MSRTVLVVDDEEAVRRLYARNLSEFGYEVRTAEDGREAVRMIEESSPALVVLDGQMPGMNGVDVLRWIRSRAQTRSLPVIMVTGLDKVEDRVLGLEAGANEYLPKPVSMSELLARVQVHLRLRPERPAAPHLTESTVLFFDLRGFSRRSEDNTDRLLAFHARLGAVMAEAGGCVEREGGTVLQYLGDGMLASWNDPTPHADPAGAAVRAAGAIVEALRAGADGWRCGIGINGGLLVGSARGTEYDVGGAVVNQAARIQEITKWVEAPVLVSRSVAQGLSPMPGRVGRFRPPGMSVELDLYEPGRPDTLGPALESFEEGRWEAAYDLLAPFPPDDRPARFLRWVCETHRRRPPQGWNGAIDVGSLR